MIASDLYDKRLELAKELGVDVGINAARENVVECVKEETGGKGADVTVECAGLESSFRSCENSCKNGGSIVIFGTHLKPVEIDLCRWD